MVTYFILNNIQSPHPWPSIAPESTHRFPDLILYCSPLAFGLVPPTALTKAPFHYFLPHYLVYYLHSTYQYL